MTGKKESIQMNQTHQIIQTNRTIKPYKQIKLSKHLKEIIFPPKIKPIE